MAQKAAVGVVTVRQLEAGTHTPRRATVDVIRRAFEAGGVEFIEENGGGPGVRLSKAAAAHLLGAGLEVSRVAATKGQVRGKTNQKKR